MSDSPAVIIYDSSGNPVKLFDLDTGAGNEHSLGVSIRLPNSGGSVAGGTLTDPIRIDPTGTTAQPISVSSLPLPTGAATEITVASLLTSATFTSRINTLGQKNMANSTPVTIASDQTAISITAASLPLPSGAATEITLATLLTTSTFTSRINTLGQKSMANSTPVVLASDQSTLSITGTVTANLGTTNGLALDTTVDSLLKETTFTNRTNTLGQKTMSGSMPVVIASDQSNLTVTGTVTSNIGTTNGLALDATLTAGSAKSIVRGGAKGTATAADVTSVSVDTNTQALHVQLAGQATAGTPLRVDPTGTTTQPVSATSLPLPTGAATETTLSSRLADTTFTSRINSLGQKTMANSTPVVLASNQSAIPVTVVDGATGGVSKTLYDIGDTVIYVGTAAQGTASSSAAWLIKKTTLDVNGNPVSTLYSSDTAIWDNRATESYS